jgi:hypothetical protein
MSPTRRISPAARPVRTAARRAVLTLLATGLSAGLPLGGCVPHGVDSLPADQTGQSTAFFEAHPTRKVDILFVVDDSGSMAEEQENLGRNFQAFVRRLNDQQDGTLDARIAVVSTDVGLQGAGLPQGDACNDARRGGETGLSGQLLTSVHDDPLDWEQSPQGKDTCNPQLPPPYYDQARCDQLRQNREWLSTNCQDIPSLLQGQSWLQSSAANPVDATELARRFRCIGSLGISGCYVEQPLEAARRALMAQMSQPNGFVRPDAHLAVVFITDEADCSVSNIKGFTDPSLPANIDLGSLCYTAAQTCTGDSQVQMTGPDGKPQTVTTYTSCDDTPGWLFSVDSYTQFLTGLKQGETGRVIVAAITGDPNYASTLGAASPQASSITFAWNDTAQDYVPSCHSANGVAAPNRRLGALAGAFPDPRSGNPSTVSICSDDFTPALQQLGDRIGGQVSTSTPGTWPPCAAASSAPPRAGDPPRLAGLSGPGRPVAGPGEGGDPDRSGPAPELRARLPDRGGLRPLERSLAEVPAQALAQ